MSLENRLERRGHEEAAEGDREDLKKGPLSLTPKFAESISSDANLVSGEKCQIDESEPSAGSQSVGLWDGTELRERREAAGLRQQDLADELGISTAAISYVENDTITESFPAEYVQAIERILIRRAA